METVECLEELFALRDGRSKTVQRLDWLFSDTGRPVVVVDWMCFDTEIFMAIIDSTIHISFTIQYSKLAMVSG
jgi:hypothetical protein